MCGGGASEIFSSSSPPEDFKWNSPNHSIVDFTERNQYQYQYETDKTKRPPPLWEGPEVPNEEIGIPEIDK